MEDMSNGAVKGKKTGRGRVDCSVLAQVERPCDREGRVSQKYGGGRMSRFGMYMGRRGVQRKLGSRQTMYGGQLSM